MKFDDAKKLHNEDEVIIKKTGRALQVISTEVYEKNKNNNFNAVIVYCEDGNKYHHTEIK